MATPIYTYAQLKTRVNSRIKGKIGILVDARESLNAAVREVASKLDLRSARRKAQLTPNLLAEYFEYAAPSDLKSYGVIGIAPQADREAIKWRQVPSEEFRQRKENGTLAVEDAEFSRKLLVSARVDDEKLTVASLDALTSGGGTWEAFGDGENLRADQDDYVYGNGSLRWDISSAGGTTAGVQNSSLNSFDLTDYLQGNGCLIVEAKLASATDVTNFILRIGSSTSDYYSKTVTAQADGTAFVAGWNKLRFDLTSLTETGTVDDDSCDFIAIYMTKSTGKVSETDYRFDNVVLRRGEINHVRYYTKYGWMATGGASYKENSTADSDLLLADTDEFDLIVEKAVELIAPEVDEDAAAEKAAAKFEKDSAAYQRANPSEALLMISTYADF